jgi:pimeloyl-ACP methyl ester carboxylesterase
MAGIGFQRRMMVAEDGTPIATLMEDPLFFPAGDETLFGILTAPPDRRASVGVIVLGGGGTTPTVIGRNRFWVTLARRLGRLGHPSLRFDYHGLGESTGSARFRLDRPFLGDLAGAVGVMEDSGISGHVLVGSCFGARTALAGGDGIAGLRGCVLLAPPLRDLGLSEPRTEGWRLADYAMAAVRPRRLLDPKEKLTLRRYLRFLGSGVRMVTRRVRRRLRGGQDDLSWVSKRFLDPLMSLARREVPLLLLYGTKDEEYADFDRARRGRLGEILERSPSVEIRTLEGQVHGFTRVDSQGPTMDAIVDWITRVAEPR